MPAAITFVIPGIETSGATRGAGAAVSPVDPSIGRLKTSVTVTAQRGAGDANVSAEAIPGEDVVLTKSPEDLSCGYIPIPRGSCCNPSTTTRSSRAARRRSRRARCAFRPGCSGASRKAQPYRARRAASSGTCWFGRFTSSPASPRTRRQILRPRRSSRPSTPGSMPACTGSSRQACSVKDATKSRIASGEAPSLVLIHGTFSETTGTFGKLWKEHPQLVDVLFERFPDRVYALDHPTLGASPIANAITLAEAAPEGARLHLLTHSRGGLVAEVLARVCSEPVGVRRAVRKGRFECAGADQARRNRRPETHFGRSGRPRCLPGARHPARLQASRRLRVGAEVGAGARPDSHRRPAGQFSGRSRPSTRGSGHGSGSRRADPDSPLVQWLHATDKPIKGDLRVVAGDLEGNSVTTWVKTLLSDAFFWTDNDLVVQTRSMYGGSPREKDSTFVLDQGGKVSHFNYFSNTQTASAVANALTAKEDTSPDGFSVIGPLSWAGESSTGVRAALPTRSAAKAAELPALFVLPGILGTQPFLEVRADEEGRPRLLRRSRHIRRNSLDQREVRPRRHSP